MNFLEVMTLIRIALVQMDSRDDVEDNLIKVERFIREAKVGGADLVAFPEFMNFLPFSKEKMYIEKEDGRTTKLLQKLAEELDLVIHAGSILIDSSMELPFNQSFIVEPDGSIKGRYSKLHLFDAKLPGGVSFKESELYRPGNEIVTTQVFAITVGMAICYDFRFSELFRIMTGMGAKIIFVPGNFTRSTGLTHLKPVLRARAIENEVFIISSDQTGRKKKTESFGHSMVIAPDGQVVALKKMGEGLLFYDLDIGMVDRQRERLPLLHHAREDVYSRYR